MANTGIKNVLTLRKYVNGMVTSEVKNNVAGDPDYIAPYEDLVDCPTVLPTTTTTTSSTTTSTTITPPSTTVDITGVTAPIVQGDVDNYGATVGGTTTGNITYTWRVTKGEITGGTYDGSLRSVLTGTAASVPGIEVTWGLYGTGAGLIELDVTRGGVSNSDSETVNVLPLYYIFNACDGGTTVIDQLSTPPTMDQGLGQRYVDLSQQTAVYYVWSGFSQADSSGYPVVDLQAVTPTAYGCPSTSTTTLAPESITITGPFTAASAGESGIEYTVNTVYPTTEWVLTDQALAEFNPVDITITTSTSGTGTSTFEVTFGPYNGDGTETLRSQIIATSGNVTPQVSGTIEITQGPS